ncbi:ATP-binding protein [Mesobacillus subterraneus]|uniref:histidine kinase n=1 Tax=Mesobacillus subterraneus TaxID=285983 RepID=A0A427TNU9_9BACI|nr:ATP-binding protein [Mesobacillus subterraneus]RSD26045.1 GHKL domain-containing protein [Mesobacillus subterraneus]
MIKMTNTAKYEGANIMIEGVCSSRYMLHPLKMAANDHIQSDGDTAFRKQTWIDFTALVKKKAELEREASLLDQEIIRKQEILVQMQNMLQTAGRELHGQSAVQLAAGLAHEIRNPLTTIKGFIQLLQPELESSVNQEFAAVALDEINRANNLLTEFISVLKPRYSEKTKLCFNQLVSNMVKLFLSEALLKNIEIKLQNNAKDLYVFGDEDALKQVIINLLKNAIEAVEVSPAGKGMVAVEVREEQGYVGACIVDNGTGIDEFSLVKIFTPFYTTKVNGTGIGLTISKQIIEEHGGEMEIHTEPGKTSFKFNLPKMAE